MDSHIGCAMSGLTADARTLIDHGRVESQVRGADRQALAIVYMWRSDMLASPSVILIRLKCAAHIMHRRLFFGKSDH